MNFLKSESLDLNALRYALIRMEDTIIYGLIERAQYKVNPEVYERGHFHFANDFEGSFLGYFLHQTEKLHASVRRYASPDEYNFTGDLPEPILPPIVYDNVYRPQSKINFNKKILPLYRDKIVPSICGHGSDSNYGSSATLDVDNLQALSKRIHYGKFVAEAKFCNPATHDKYVELIQKRDREGLLELLTNKEVEKRLLNRVVRKAMAYGQDITDTSQTTVDLKLSPGTVADLYEKWIIPMTKEVEIEYLLRRLDNDNDVTNYGNDAKYGEVFSANEI